MQGGYNDLDAGAFSHQLISVVDMLRLYMDEGHKGRLKLASNILMLHLIRPAY